MNMRKAATRKQQPLRRGKLSQRKKTNSPQNAGTHAVKRAAVLQRSWTVVMIITRPAATRRKRLLKKKQPKVPAPLWAKYTMTKQRRILRSIMMQRHPWTVAPDSRHRMKQVLRLTVKSRIMPRRRRRLLPQMDRQQRLRSSRMPRWSESV